MTSAIPLSLRDTKAADYDAAAERLHAQTDDELIDVLRNQLRDAMIWRNAARCALIAGEEFLAACNSAWACGETPHRVRAMLDRADTFRNALDELEHEE